MTKKRSEKKNKFQKENTALRSKSISRDNKNDKEWGPPTLYNLPMDPYGNINPPLMYGYESEGSASYDVPNYNPYAPSDVPNYNSYAPPPPQGAYGNPVPPPVYGYAPPQGPYGGSGYDRSSSAFDGDSEEYFI